MSSVQRTKSGCWTCRLRRKKCSEGGPPCLTCADRGITCHGYGPKPDWKDRGDKEKEEALRLQIQARRPSYATSTKSRRASLESPVTVASTPGASTRSAEDIVDPSPGICSLDTNLNDFNFGSLDDPADMAIFSTSLDLNSMAGLTDLESCSPWDKMLSQESVAEWALTSNVTLQPMDFTSNYLLMPVTGTTSLQDAEVELELAMHFVDTAFSDMVPHSSYRMSSMRQKSWVASFMVRSSTFKAAALSMSAFHSGSSLAADYAAQKQSLDIARSYKSRAKAAFEALPAEPPSRLREPFPGTLLGEKFICSVQIALLDRLEHPSQSSDLAFCTALSLLNENPLLAILLTEAKTRLPEPHGDLGRGDAEALSVGEGRQPTSMELQGLRFFSSVLVWDEILQGLSERRELRARDALCKLLNHHEFATAFERTIGVESWLALVMVDTAGLEAWKEGQLANGNLSVRKLVSEAESIERRLESEVDRISSSLGGAPPLDGEQEEDGVDEDRRWDLLQTSILAHAVLVHLNTVVSGASSGVPEIQQSIKRAAAAWERLPPSRSMNSKTLAWSFCACASLVSGVQRVYFQELLRKLAAVLRMGEISLLMERCWEALDRGGSGRCDWRDFLRRYDQPII